ncbi:DUF4830 domain-containing protein [Cohnella sp. REN36]|uniref:DUF4830 domain-containing protein n=1 Tax=Cohnella sp. REN36 TaxID=2887347 RepID=UPI001D15DD07|nr:DUF4830 domain-containing protein [Cohnella sp. REN36]MCC3375436.1 DUF4830 domain-containing protein [Cohnella sp. REN36]
MIVLFSIFCLVFLIGCGKETTEQNNVKHMEYLKSFGWHIEEKMSERTQDTKNYLPATNAGIDLKPYKEIYITTYLLKEKQKTGKKIYADIYQMNEDIIGGSGHLETWEPGDFSLKDKERLINEGTINN